MLEFLLNAADPKQVRAIAAKACNPDPGERYSSVLELSNDVERFLDGQPVRAYRELPYERAARWIGHNRTLVILILTYVVVRSVIFFSTRR